MTSARHTHASSGSLGRSQKPSDKPAHSADDADQRAIEAHGCITVVHRKRRDLTNKFRLCEARCSSTERGKTTKGMNTHGGAASGLYLVTILDYPPMYLCRHCAKEIQSFWKEFCDAHVDKR